MESGVWPRQGGCGDEFAIRGESQLVMATNMLNLIQLVVIPVQDQERSVAFYESLGFERRNDAAWGDGERWVEVYPPGTSTGLALVPPEPGASTGIRTGIILDTDDIDRAHAELRAKGVDVDPEIARVGAGVKIRIGPVETADPVPPMFYFRDPDGNVLMVVQPG